MTSKGRVTSLDAPININGEGEEITLLDTILGAAFQERENIEKKDRINLVKEKLKRLDTTEQFILVEFFYRGRSHKEIGRLIGKSEDAVSEQKRRIIEKIKKEIKNDVDFT
jgi:RNA polymerase sigma factor (sigma-70 family)